MCRRQEGNDKPIFCAELPPVPSGPADAQCLVLASTGSPRSEFSAIPVGKTTSPLPRLNFDCHILPPSISPLRNFFATAKAVRPKKMMLWQVARFWIISAYTSARAGELGASATWSARLTSILAFLSARTRGVARFFKEIYGTLANEVVSPACRTVIEIRNPKLSGDPFEQRKPEEWFSADKWF